jgi:hypothetical protein
MRRRDHTSLVPCLGALRFAGRANRKLRFPFFVTSVSSVVALESVVDGARLRVYAAMGSAFRHGNGRALTARLRS